MSQWIRPASYTAFAHEEEGVEWCKRWGLLTEKAAKRKAFRYKGHNMDVSCEIMGFADRITAVIQVDNQLHCIHPSFLKEMQSARFGNIEPEEQLEQVEPGEQIEPIMQVEPTEHIESIEQTDPRAAQQEQTEQPTIATIAVIDDVIAPEEMPNKVAEIKEKPKKAEKKAALILPEGKVSVEGILQAFAKVPNHFSDEDDEVVIFEKVSINTGAETFVLEAAWSSYSNSLKKLELQVGDQVKFEAKIAAKKLTRYPVKYKLNNAAKITKLNPA